MKKIAIFLAMVMLISVFCGCVSDSGTTVSKGDNSNNVSSTNSQKDKNESSNTASADTSSDVSGDSSETSGDNSNEASGDGSSDTSSDLSNESSGNGEGAGNGNGTESGTGNGAGTENGTGNGNGTENGTGTEEENEPVPPVIDPDYIENPTDADIELFYDFVHKNTDGYCGEGVFWPGCDDIDFGNYSDTLSLALTYYEYFGFKTERLESEGRGCGDPLNRFIISDDLDLAVGFYVYATVYDIETLNWICENVFNNTAVYPDDKVGYCHEGKFYDAYYGGPTGYPPIRAVEYKKSYKYLGNGQYRFTIYYDMDDSTGGGCRYTMNFVAIPKYDEKIGTYWKLISYDLVKREIYDRWG